MAFLAVRHVNQGRLSRDFIAAALEHLVVVVLVFTFQSLFGKQWAVAAFGGDALDFQAQGRTLLECLGQFDQRTLGILVQLAGAWRERHRAEILGTATTDQSTNHFEWRRSGFDDQIAQGLPDNRHHAELRIVQVARHG